MPRKYFDFDLQTDASSGEDDVRVMVKRAETMGFNCIAISDYLRNRRELEELSQHIDDIETEIDVQLGVKIKTSDRKQLKKKINLFRDLVPVIIVDGGEVDINRAAVEDSKVDVLAHPNRGRKNAGIDHVIAREAGDNDVALQLSFQQLLTNHGKYRSHVLKQQRRIVRLCQKYDAPLVTSNSTGKAHEIRGGRALAALPYTLGLELDEALDTVSDNCSSMLKRAQEVKDRGFIRPGVYKRESGEEEKEGDNDQSG